MDTKAQDAMTDAEHVIAELEEAWRLRALRAAADPRARTCAVASFLATWAGLTVLVHSLLHAPNALTAGMLGALLFAYGRAKDHLRQAAWASRWGRNASVEVLNVLVLGTAVVCGRDSPAILYYAGAAVVTHLAMVLVRWRHYEVLTGRDRRTGKSLAQLEEV
jgi:cation transport ATPase